MPNKTADTGAEAPEEAVTLEGLAEIVLNLSKTVKELVERPAPTIVPSGPATLPRAKTPAEILKGMRVGENRGGQDRVDVLAQQMGIRPRFRADTSYG